MHELSNMRTASAHIQRVAASMLLAVWIAVTLNFVPARAAPSPVAASDPWKAPQLVDLPHTSNIVLYCGC